MRPRTLSASASSGRGNGKTSSSWISPRTSAFAKDVTSAAVAASAWLPPCVLPGPAGVGKTELAKALSRYLDRSLVRLQCYEGLDEAKALYEWNYRKQLLRIQAEERGAGWEAVQEDIFSEEFLLARPLMTAIAAEEPVVLLIDEI